MLVIKHSFKDLSNIKEAFIQGEKDGVSTVVFRCTTLNRAEKLFDGLNAYVPSVKWVDGSSLDVDDTLWNYNEEYTMYAINNNKMSLICEEVVNEIEHNIYEIL